MTKISARSKSRFQIFAERATFKKGSTYSGLVSKEGTGTLARTYEENLNHINLSGLSRPIEGNITILLFFTIIVWVTLRNGLSYSSKRYNDCLGKIFGIKKCLSTLIYDFTALQQKSTTDLGTSVHRRLPILCNLVQVHDRITGQRTSREASRFSLRGRYDNLNSRTFSSFLRLIRLRSASETYSTSQRGSYSFPIVRAPISVATCGITTAIVNRFTIIL